MILMKTLILILLVSLAACAHKTTYQETSWSEKNSEGLGLRVDWIKQKSDTLDTSFSLTNRYPFEVVIPENSLQCVAAGEGTFSPVTNRRLVIPPGGTRQGVAIFRFNQNMRNAPYAVVTLTRAHKGQESTELVSESSTVSSAFGSATARRVGNQTHATGSAIGVARSTGRTYEALGFKEGERLPPVELRLILGERSPASK
jgi:hypothetical protein